MQKKPNKHIFQDLQIIRFLDDWAYQANVRAEIRNNSDNLTNNTIQKEMEKFEKLLFDKFGIKRVKVEYSFPWNRFFEIKINIHRHYAQIPFIDILFKDL